MSNYFFEFYYERLNFIYNYCIDKLEGVILLCTYIDALGGYRFNEKTRRSGFTKLLLEKSSQANMWKHICILRFIKDYKKSNPYPHDILDFFEKLISNNPAKHTCLTYNPYKNFIDLSNKAKENGIDISHLEKDIQKYKYVDILWNDYRNPAIHESSIFEAPNLGNSDSPGYNYNLDLNEFVFFIPKVFIFESVKSCLENLEDEYRKGIWSPY